jgi:hypothetical protein
VLHAEPVVSSQAGLKLEGIRLRIQQPQIRRHDRPQARRATDALVVQTVT